MSSENEQIILTEEPIDPTLTGETPEPIAALPEIPISPAEVPEQTYIYQPTDENNRPIGGKQVLKYRTQDELVAKLQEQNVLLVRKLRSETKKNRLGIVEDEVISADAPRFDVEPDYTPRQLTADQRVKLSRDLLDPERFDEVTDTLFEAKLGVKPQEIGKTLSKLSADNVRLNARIEADAFVASNPDYVKDDENFKAITNWMVRYNLAPVRSNFQMAFNTLKADGLLIMAEQPNPVQETIAPTPVAAPVLEQIPSQSEQTVPAATVPAEATRFAPAQIPTGLTKGDSADQGQPRSIGDDIVYEGIVGGKKRLYRGMEAVNVMPSEEFKRRANNEKGFVQKVERLEAEYAKGQGRQR